MPSGAVIYSSPDIPCFSLLKEDCPNTRFDIIQKINELDSKLELWIAVRTDIWNATNIGGSVSVNGVCLTVVDIKDDVYEVIVIKETLARTNLSELRIGDIVNILASYSKPFPSKSPI